jgi:hypothetical protein
MIDQANWEDGKISEWTDASAAKELEMPLETLRYQRRKLENNLYIATNQKKHGLEIVINNWTNPREYSGQVYNAVEGGNKLQPSSIKGCNKGCNKGDKPLPLIPSNSTESHNHINDEDSLNPEPVQEPAEIEDIEPRSPLKPYRHEIRPFIQAICDLWGLEPPLDKSQIDYWRSGAVSLKDACGEFGVDMITTLHEDSLNSDLPWTVASPKSLVNRARAKAGQLRTGVNVVHIPGVFVH